MSLISQKQIFFLNSNQRLTGTSSDFTVNLDFDPGKEFDSVALLQCLIPQSYYLIQSGQNTFTLHEGVSSVTVSIPIGNYTRRSFSIVLGSTITSASPNHWTYTVSYATSNQADTGKYTYTVSGNGGVQPSFQFKTFCYSAMGFNENTSYNFSANTLNSANVIKLIPEDSLLVHSDICSNHNDDVLQDIVSGSTNTFGAITFQNFDVESNYKIVTSSKNNVYRFYLTTTDNLAIDLNGQEMSITLLLFKKNTIWSQLTGFIKYLLLKEK